MGANMARRLKDCGYDVTAVNDVNQEVAAELAAELGAKLCENLAELTAAADVIFTVVTNDDAMRGIFLSGDDNLLKGAAGKTFVNCATLSPGIQKEVADAAAAAGASAIEGCMASSISHAREGKLLGAAHEDAHEDPVDGVGQHGGEAPLSDRRRSRDVAGGRARSLKGKRGARQKAYYVVDGKKGGITCQKTEPWK